jgi:hypothetical protein
MLTGAKIIPQKGNAPLCMHELLLVKIMQHIKLSHRYESEQTSYAYIMHTCLPTTITKGCKQEVYLKHTCMSC